MRILAPLIVVAVFAAVAVRWIADPVLERDRAWVAGSWNLATQRADVKERFVARLDGLLERGGADPEIRWFAARAWLKIGEVARCLDAVWGDPALADAPGTPRRFGALLLRGLGFVDDEGLQQPRTAAAMSCLVLAEGGDQEAAAWLDQLIRTHLESGFFNLLYGTFLYGTQDGVERVADALRARGEPEADILAALATLGPDPYPERRSDLALLEDVVLRDEVREIQLIVWPTVCLALGRSEDAGAVDVLETLYRRLSASGSEAERENAAVVAASLLAAGRWSMLEPLAPYLGEKGGTSKVRVWYAEALQNRLNRGDPEAPEAWTALWEALQRYPDPLLAVRVATSLLLRDTRPPASLPVARVLRDLEAEGGLPSMHAVAAAWRYREGETAGRYGLLRVLLRLAEGGWTGDDLLIPTPTLISPVLTACRGLYLYDPTARP